MDVGRGGVAEPPAPPNLDLRLRVREDTRAEREPSEPTTGVGLDRAEAAAFMRRVRVVASTPPLLR